MATEQELQAEIEQLEQALAPYEALAPELKKQMEALAAPQRQRLGELKAQLAEVRMEVRQGVGFGGDNKGTVNIYNAAPGSLSPEELRRGYLKHLMRESGRLSLAGVDPALAAKEEAGDERLELNAVYVALLTLAARETPENGHRHPVAMPDTQGEQNRRLSALEQLDAHHRLVLQGDPGSGKSTFVRFVTLCLCGELLGDDSINLQRLTEPLPQDRGEPGKERQPWRHGALLPLPVVLRDFAADLPKDSDQANSAHLWGFIEKGLRKQGLLGEYAPALRNELLEQGGLILLDGLDEVPESNQRREQVKRAVESFALLFDKCRFLITTRTYAYQNQDWRLEGFDEAVLAPLSRGQIHRFIDGWYAHAAALGRFNEADALGRAQLLKQAVFHPGRRLYDLAERPLLLTLMASLHAWRGGSLPEERAGLYADTVQLLLDFWETRRIKRNEKGEPILIQESLVEWLKTDRKKVQVELQRLAYEAHAAQPELTGTADIAEETLFQALRKVANNPDARHGRLVEFLSDRAGLLIPHGDGVYTFPHRSFQEYLAALHLNRTDYPQRAARLAREDPDRWREVALLSPAGSIPSVWQLAGELCFRGPEDPSADEPDEWGALIAARALTETADLDPDSLGNANRAVLERLRAWLVRLIRSHRLPATERAEAGENLTRIGDPRFDPARWGLPIGPSLGFLEVLAGPFQMGSDEFTEEKPRHPVRLPAYYMARWSVTVDQFVAFLDHSGHRPADNRRRQGRGNLPVVHVTWHDALAYCRWLDERLREVAPQWLERPEVRQDPASLGFWRGIRHGELQITLPSEAEWEKAARGTDGREYPWGPEADPERANYDDTDLGARNPVGCFPGGETPFGCEELAGNVWEWTRSLWGKGFGEPEYRYPYTEMEEREVLGAPDDVLRVLRGGAFSSNPRRVRCAFRNWSDPDLRNDLIGFRVAASPFSGR